MFSNYWAQRAAKRTGWEGRQTTPGPGGGYRTTGQQTDRFIGWQCGGSGIRLFSFPDPGSELSPSRIPDPGSSKNLSILTLKNQKKWFLSSKNYAPGCSSRIPDPDADFLPSRIPDPGVKKAPNPGSRIRIRNTDGWAAKRRARQCTHTHTQKSRELSEGNIEDK
jgi:hypothetical protein